MKRLITLLVLVFIFGLTYGKRVSEYSAKIVGQTFLTNATNLTAFKTVANLQLVYTANSKSIDPLAPDQPTNFFYVFNTGSIGFVIVAGDDNATPILGYSHQGTFEPDNLPQNVAKWLEGYKSEIRYIIENNIQATDEISEEWENLSKNIYPYTSATGVSGVNPLMQTLWNQAPFYNDLCPDGSVTGCVATAMAQIMKYWNYPATGSGFHSYNHEAYGTLSANFGSTTYQWSSMPNSVNSSNTAVATLMYQVGVSVDMSYSPEVSGAYVISAQSPVINCSEYALKTYFGYKGTLQGVQRVNYNQAQWISLLKTELNARRPVLYAGFGSGGGHCFVADGFDNNDYIHFNWGWGGYYDGFFQINALNPSGTGTGGGSGGYNSGHQAVIGIEPPTENQTYNLALYDYVTPSASSISYGQSLTVSTNIANYGSNTFNGDYTAAIFDNQYNFVDFVQILSGYSLSGGNAYMNNLVFSTTGLYSMLPGIYHVEIFYRPTGKNWYAVANSGNYSNLVQLTVTYSNDIELYSAMTVTPGTTLTKGQPASVNLNIVNRGSGTFIGKYGIGLYTLDGNLAQTIGILNEINGLPSGYTYLAPYLTFTTSSITVEPGTYLLAVQHNPNDTGWKLTGSTNYQNPIKVTVVAPTLLPDIYEENNSVGQAYNLPISFAGNNASKNTNGSNCHITSDNDFYKVVLPSGFNYTITPRIHDSYNSGNGNIYTLDGLFSYSTDGTGWSSAYDDVMSGNIALKGGGTVYFHVAPYFAGETGTYLLDLALTRTSASGIAEEEINNLIKVYPNPVKDYLTIDLNEFNGILNQINLFNIHGQIVVSKKSNMQETTFNLMLNSLSDGIYFLQFQTNVGVITRKIVIEK
ncbi:MAG: thiol protease/hemagglutinin PrtT [Bacteroidia bacterium]|nr:thiol protease/hemagglutinin PrtT [Bacteroidia bacterium]